MKHMLLEVMSTAIAGKLEASPISLLCDKKILSNIQNLFDFIKFSALTSVIVKSKLNMILAY